MLTAFSILYYNLEAQKNDSEEFYWIKSTDRMYNKGIYHNQ